jgi:beta-glucosidase
MHRMPKHALSLIALVAAPFAAASAQQPALSARAATIITVDGLRFKDLNHNGARDPYEDWRLSPESGPAISSDA